MKIERAEIPYNLDVIYRLTISHRDTVGLKFMPFDYALIAECEKSESVADKLLMLEMIARKIEESQACIGKAD